MTTTTTTTAPARIVVGVDGSPASVEALRWAVAQARLTSATVRAVTSWQNPTQYGFDHYSGEVDWADIAHRTLETALKEAGNGSPLDVESAVLYGHPAQTLVQASAGAQLLVVGSRGHGGFAGLLLGSVSEHVIAHASCPVLVIRGDASAPAAAPVVPAVAE